MSAVTSNITIEQGSDFARGWQVIHNGAAIDPSWTAASQIRRSASSEEVLHEFSAEVMEGGAVVIAISAAESSAINSWRKGVYDVEVTSPTGLVRRVAQGSVTISPEVTR